MKRHRINEDVWYLENALRPARLRKLNAYLGKLESTMGRAGYDRMTCGPNFWFPLNRRPAHLIEEVVRDLRRFGDPKHECAGAEWWFNIRPSTDGMALHFDKDEGLMQNQGAMRNPSRSSVLYLTEAGHPTLIQSLRGKDLETSDWDERPMVQVFVPPKVNRYLVFSGDLSHGSALPAQNQLVIKESRKLLRIVLAVNWWKKKPLPPWCTELNAAQVSALYRMEHPPAGLMPRVPPPGRY